MAEVALDAVAQRRLKRQIVQFGSVHGKLDRQNLLDNAGLLADDVAVEGTLIWDGGAEAFAGQLIRVLQQRGILESTGQPALVKLLRELRELVRGHPEEVAFLDGLLLPYPPVGLPAILPADTPEVEHDSARSLGRPPSQSNSGVDIGTIPGPLAAQIAAAKHRPQVPGYVPRQQFRDAAIKPTVVRQERAAGSGRSGGAEGPAPTTRPERHQAAANEMATRPTPVTASAPIQPAANPMPVMRWRLGLGILAGVVIAVSFFRGVDPTAITWVVVPAGSFIMGSDYHSDDEKPQRLLTLPEFKVSKYETTNAQYQAFVTAADGYQNSEWWERPVPLASRAAQPGEPSGMGADLPADNVDWYEAVAYTRWLTAKLRTAGRLEAEKEVRLPTEEEWEKAARGTDGREYPWGNGYKAGYANVDEQTTGAGPARLGRAAKVGSYGRGASPFGALDMAGNVWEWTLSEYGSGSPGDLTNDRPRVLRGGSWVSLPGLARASFRISGPPLDRRPNRGFRVVVAAPVP